MRRSSIRLMVSLAAASIPVAAFAHNHITVDTATGSPGDPIQIRAGYLPAESAYSIVGGRLYFGDEPAVYSVDEPLADSDPYNGWHAGDEVLLTSDFFFATGRLDGGNFMWELSLVARVTRGDAVLAWGEFAEDDGGEPFMPMALSDGATRLERSFDTGIGGHVHDQGYAFSAPGLYDVTFIAWDSNGRYADSEPVTVQFEVVPAPGGAALLAIGALAMPFRRRPATVRV